VVGVFCFLLSGPAYRKEGKPRGRGEQRTEEGEKNCGKKREKRRSKIREVLVGKNL